MTRGVISALCALACALVAGGCAGGQAVEPSAKAAAPACPADWKPGWQALANRIHTPVYCPSWLPDPLTGRLGGRWNNIDSVDDRDGSYLIGFLWQEVGSGELHVNLRAYPHRTAIPNCRDVTTGAGGKARVRTIPCFADPNGHRRAAGFDATVYTVNQDADQWHVLYAWRRAGSLYTLSEHVALPLTYKKVLANLDRMLRGLVLVPPK